MKITYYSTNCIIFPHKENDGSEAKQLKSNQSNQEQPKTARRSPKSSQARTGGPGRRHDQTITPEHDARNVGHSLPLAATTTNGNPVLKFYKEKKEREKNVIRAMTNFIPFYARRDKKINCFKLPFNIYKDNVSSAAFQQRH